MLVLTEKTGLRSEESFPIEKKRAEENFNKWSMKMPGHSQRLLPIRYLMSAVSTTPEVKRLAQGPRARKTA